jgi:hypothetical protein
MIGYGLMNCLRRPVLWNDQTASVEESMKECVDPANMIEHQERDCPQGLSLGAITFEKELKVMQDRFGCAGCSGREQD